MLRWGHADVKVGGVCSARASCVPRVLALCQKMKPILHFMPVCSVDLYQSLLALISVEVGFVPDYGWASESHSACVMISLFSPLLLQSLWTKLIFFVQKRQPCTIPWPGEHVICFSLFFLLYHVKVMSPLFSIVCLWAFRIIITEVEGEKQTGDRGVECRMLTVKYWEHRYVAAVIDVLFLLVLCVFGRLPKRVIDYLRNHAATKHLAAWPEVAALGLSYARLFLPVHKQSCNNEDIKPGSLLFSVIYVSYVRSVRTTFSFLCLCLCKASILRNRRPQWAGSCCQALENITCIISIYS